MPVALLAFFKKFAWPLAIAAVVVVFLVGVWTVAFRAGSASCEMDHLEEQLDLGQKIVKADRKIIAASPKGADIDAMLKYTRKYAVTRD